MFYCHLCRIAINGTEFEKGQFYHLDENSGKSENEVLCFKCISKDYCTTENCTENVKKKGKCESCNDKYVGQCINHAEYTKNNVVVNTNDNDKITTTSFIGVICEKCFVIANPNERCSATPNTSSIVPMSGCHTKKTTCTKCSKKLDECSLHATYTLKNNFDNIPCCMECYVIFQCNLCALHKADVQCDSTTYICKQCSTTKLNNLEEQETWNPLNALFSMCALCAYK